MSCEKREEALEKYGYIKNWNVSEVTDMSGLFYDCLMIGDEDLNKCGKYVRYVQRFLF